MQDATSAITFPHIASRLYLHSLQRPNHTSITSRFCVHGTRGRIADNTLEVYEQVVGK